MADKSLECRGFDKFKGKTVKKVDARAINDVTFHFTDGSLISINADERVSGFSVIIAGPVVYPKKKVDKPTAK